MKQLIRRYYSIVFLIAMFIGVSSCEARTKNFPAEMHLVASTPGDEGVQSMLEISPATKVDFIRWNLTLITTGSGNQQFKLTVNYGESQPNTLGFINGGERKSITGEFIISEDKTIHGEVVQLKSTSLPTQILLVKLSDNIYHLLTPQRQLMVGNGGWSYTLNRKEPVSKLSPVFPSFTFQPELTKDTTKQMIFVGRTPCYEIAKEKNLTVPSGCIKLKWELLLNRDPKTLEPTTYILRRTDHRQSELTGKWEIRQEINSGPNPVIVELDADKPKQSISLWLADKNVAFLLAKDNNLFTGDENFSYTLNRVEK